MTIGPWIASPAENTRLRISQDYLPTSEEGSFPTVYQVHVVAATPQIINCCLRHAFLERNLSPARSILDAESGEIQG